MKRYKWICIYILYIYIYLYYNNSSIIYKNLGNLRFKLQPKAHHSPQKIHQKASSLSIPKRPPGPCGKSRLDPGYITPGLFDTSPVVPEVLELNDNSRRFHLYFLLATTWPTFAGHLCVYIFSLITQFLHISGLVVLDKNILIVH